MKKGLLAVVFASMFLLSSCALFIYEDEDDDRYGCDDGHDTLMIIYSSKADNPVLP